MRTKLPKEKWTPDAVKEYILECRKDKGIPMFKTKYAGVHLSIGNSPATIAMCWAGEDVVGSKIFTDVPKSDIDLLEEGFGDWKRLLMKYGTARDLEEAKRYGIYVKSWSLPRFQSMLHTGVVLK